MIKEKYAKVFVEESTTNLIKENQYGVYLSNDEFKKFFVDPFTDVLKVAKIALKDVGTGVLYNMRILFTFSTNKKQALLKAYEQKRDQFKKEYEPIMSRIDERMDDAKYIAFMASPASFLAFQAAKQGIDAAKFVNDTFKEQRAAMKGMGPDGKPTRPEAGPIVGALRDLKNLFFGESYVIGQLLEVEGESPDIEAEITTALEEIGVDPAEIQQNFAEWVKLKEDAMKEIEDEGVPARIEALVAMMNAKEYEELEKSVASAKSAGIDLGNYLKEFETELKKGEEEISIAFEEDAKKAEGEETPEADSKKKKDTPLIASLKKMPKIKKLGDKATKEDFTDATKESLFNTLKDNLQEDGEKIITEIQTEMREVAGIILAPYKDVSELAELKEIGGEAAAIAQKIESAVKAITG